MSIVDQYLNSQFSVGRLETFQIQFDIDGNVQSRIHARVETGTGILALSDDLLSGYRRRNGNFGGVSFLAPPSNPPVSFPDEAAGISYYPAYGGIGSNYVQLGPAEGRY
jgi:hypothetical protein